MPSRTLIDRLTVVATGAICGAIVWQVFSRPEVRAEGVAIFERPPARDASRAATNVQLARLDPIETFGIFPKRDLSSEGPAADVGALKLLGTSASPTRKAVLISVGGATAQWIAVGAPAAGLELVELGPSQAVVRSASGQTTTLYLFPPVSTTSASGSANENESR